MKSIIQESEYKVLINQIPIFYIDFLITYIKKNLLLKRNDEPLRNKFWVVGGRLRLK